MKKEKVICPRDKNFNENILFLFKISSVRENMLLYQGHEIFMSADYTSQEMHVINQFACQISIMEATVLNHQIIQ